jgi:hypothetical protein
MLFTKSNCVIQIRVLCAIKEMITGSVFSHETNSERYVRKMIVSPFLNQLNDAEKSYSYFMQDNATARTKNNSIHALD